MVEEHLCTFLVEADIAQLVADDEIEALEAKFKVPERFLRLGLAYECQQMRDRGEEDGVSFQAGLDTKSYGDVRCRTRVSSHCRAAR